MPFLQHWQQHTYTHTHTNYTHTPSHTHSVDTHTIHQADALWLHWPAKFPFPIPFSWTPAPCLGSLLGHPHSSLTVSSIQAEAAEAQGQREREAGRAKEVCRGGASGARGVRGEERSLEMRRGGSTAAFPPDSKILADLLANQVLLSGFVYPGQARGCQ